MREIFFLATIFISVTVVYTDNFCTGERAGGLLALTLCKLNLFIYIQYTANYYSHSTAFVQSKDCNANLITAIDSALSLTVMHYSQTTANVQLITALIAKSDKN